MSPPDQQPARRVILTPASEIHAELPSHDWGPWKLNKRERILNLDPDTGYHYPIELDRFDSSAELLDIICQVAEKTWADAATVAGLVWALSDILNPQANVCSWGKDRTISPADIRRLVAAYRPERA